MDVLKPQLEWIDGMCYRINPVDFGSYASTHETVYYEPEDTSCVLEAAEDDIDDITTDETGRCRTSFHIPSAFFAYLIGSKGSTKKNLEYETRTQINIPKQGRDGDIVVTGASKRSVASARNRIYMMVKGARNRKKPTHFISIPLSNPLFKRKFLLFKSSVLQNCLDRGVDESIFMNENKLHLTICALVICDEIERKETAVALNNCKAIVDEILNHTPLKVKMEGLDYMNDDPSSVNVLYAKVTSDNLLLQNLVDKIKSFFVNIHTSKQDSRENVKIHATLMNTIFRNKDEDTKETFDARKIFELYGEFPFGECLVDKIDMSILHTTCPQTGYYNATETISLL